jgi:hypothetical protein
MNMKRLILALTLICFPLSFVGVAAQTVTRTRHQAALTTDAVTTGTLTIRKPDYICISTDGGRDQLLMEGTKFTMTMGGKKHVTDSRRNAQFATFQKVLNAVINGQPVTKGEDMTIVTKNGLQTITITPAAKKRQMFTSFVLVVDAKTSDFRQLRMNERGGNYVNYDFK